MNRKLKSGLLSIVGAVALTLSPMAYSGEKVEDKVKNAPSYEELRKELRDVLRGYKELLKEIDKDNKYFERREEKKEEKKKKIRRIRLIKRYQIC